MIRLPILLSAFALACTACAPIRIPPGPGATEPAIETSGRTARLVMDDGASLRLRSWLPRDGAAPRAVILALHGFNDHSRSFQSPGLAWAKAGIATYAYDQRGFGDHEHAGLWAGEARLAGDARTAAAVVAARHPGVPLYLLGESMGGAVALIAQAEAPIPEVAGTVLSAPAVWARETMPSYQQAALWFFARVIPWGRLSGSRLGIQASDNVAMLRALGRDPLVIKRTRVDAIEGLTDLMSAALEAAPRFDVPALLLYGAKDEIMPRDPTLALWRALPAETDGLQRRAFYETGWHMLLRDLEARTVREDIAAWITDPSAPLPSGADRAAESALSEEESEPEAESEADAD